MWTLFWLRVSPIIRIGPNMSFIGQVLSMNPVERYGYIRGKNDVKGEKTECFFIQNHWSRMSYETKIYHNFIIQFPIKRSLPHLHSFNVFITPVTYRVRYSCEPPYTNGYPLTYWLHTHTHCTHYEIELGWRGVRDQT